jgi:hypothetical protein
LRSDEARRCRRDAMVGKMIILMTNLVWQVVEGLRSGSQL